MTVRGILLAAVAVGAMAVFAGCQNDKAYPEPAAVEPPPEEVIGPRAERSPAERERVEDAVAKDLKRVPEQATNEAAEQSGMALPAEEQPTNLDREAVAELVAWYQLDDVQVAVLSREALDKQGLGDDVAQRLREAFSELGMRVQNAAGGFFDETDLRTVRGLAKQFDADLVVLALGSAKERSRFGQFLSYEATVRATVYEAGGDMVATKELNTTGQRSTDPDRAARSALLVATDNIGPSLVEQLVRKTGQNLMTRGITITGLRYHASVMKVIAHLKSQPGINDVRLISWDEESQTARMLVYLQPAAKDNLGAYVVGTPNLDVRIESVDRKGLDAQERKVGR